MAQDKRKSTQAEDARARWERVRACRREKRFADMLAELDTLCAESPNDPNVHLSRSIALQNLHRVDESVAAIDRAAELADCGVVAYQRACALAVGGRPEEALTAVLRALKLDPSQRDDIRADDDLLSLRGNPIFERAVAPPTDDDQDDQDDQDVQDDEDESPRTDPARDDRRAPVRPNPQKSAEAADTPSPVVKGEVFDADGRVVALELQGGGAAGLRAALARRSSVQRLELSGTAPLTDLAVLAAAPSLREVTLSRPVTGGLTLPPHVVRLCLRPGGTPRDLSGLVGSQLKEIVFDEVPKGIDAESVRALRGVAGLRIRCGERALMPETFAAVLRSRASQG